MKSKKEHSAGGVVFKYQGSSTKSQDVLWLLGKHSGYNKWVLAKGRLEGEETSREAALREVEEETGVIAKIIGDEPIHVERYTYKALLRQETGNKKQDSEKWTALDEIKDPERRVMVYQESDDFDGEDQDVVEVDKTVDFYLMEYVQDADEGHSWEMTEVGWYTFDEALEMLSFDGEKKALKIVYDE